jgi:hypothetical protein
MHEALRSMLSEEVAMEHQFFIRQQNLKLYRSLVAVSEAAAAKADARQEKLFEATGRGSSERTAAQNELRRNPSTDCIRDEACAWRKSQRGLRLGNQRGRCSRFGQINCFRPPHL